MGTWGTGLFSDDTALDVRDEYRAILGDGISEPDATQLLLESWKDALSDPDTAPVFWLALADTQWSCGRLQAAVQRQALEVIASDADLVRWQPDVQLVARRTAVLEKLKLKLASPQPAPKKIKKRFIDSTDWKVGDIYRFQLRSGQSILLHVIGFHQDRGGRAPVCGILDWQGTAVPGKAGLDRLGYKTSARSPNLSQFLFGSVGPKDYPSHRLSLEAEWIDPRQKLGGYGVILWRQADQLLELIFGLV